MEVNRPYNDPNSMQSQIGHAQIAGPDLSSTSDNAKDEQTLDPGWIVGVFKRRWWIMLGFTVCLTGIIGSLLVAKSRMTPNIYKGLFRVLVEPITSEGRLARQFMLNQASTARTDIRFERNVAETSLVDYETLMRVLKSPKLLTSVVDKLQAKYPDLTYQVLIRNLQLRRITYEQSGLEQGTKIMVVTYQDRDPEKIIFILEHIANAYLEYSRQERLTSLNQGIRFIAEQLPELQKQVDELQEELKFLREENTFIDPERTGNFLTEHALIVERNRVNTKAKLQEIEAQYNAMQQQINENISGASILARDAGAYQTLLTKLQQLESDIALQSVHLKESSKPMQKLREQQQNIRSLSRDESRQLIEQVFGEIEGVEEGYQSLLQSERKANLRLKQLPEAARKYADLQQRLEIATDSLKQFLSRREALKLDAAQRQVPWELIDPPGLIRYVDGTPAPVSNQQTKRQIALTGILSMLLGVGVGFLVEVIQTVFHTPDEVQSATKVPVIGVIPFSKELKQKSRQTVGQKGGSPVSKTVSPIATVAGLTQRTKPSFMFGNRDRNSSDSDSPFWEAFRSLYTNIRLQSFDRPIDSIVIGAAAPEDGKSTVAVNLARTAAAIGQRVLIVDTDLRCPTIHEKLELPNLRGLSDAIAADLSLNDVIQRSPNDENLFVLTAGPSPMDPMKLLTSKKMHYVREQFKAFFDLVIYDTPPLIGVADSNYLAAQTDGIVLVVGLDKTDRSLVTKSLEGLKISGAAVLGIVANGIHGYTPKSSTVNRRK